MLVLHQGSEAYTSLTKSTPQIKGLLYVPGYYQRIDSFQNGRASFSLGGLPGTWFIPPHVMRSGCILCHHGPATEEKHDRAFPHGWEKDVRPSGIHFHVRHFVFCHCIFE